MCCNWGSTSDSVIGVPDRYTTSVHRPGCSTSRTANSFSDSRSWSIVSRSSTASAAVTSALYVSGMLAPSRAASVLARSSPSTRIASTARSSSHDLTAAASFRSRATASTRGTDWPRSALTTTYRRARAESPTVAL